MKWEKMEDGYVIPVKSWCENCEEGAVKQAVNLARHPALLHHVALMPDAHQGRAPAVVLNTRHCSSPARFPRQAVARERDPPVR